MTITHLDGREINVSSEPINIFGEELECYRKLKGFGMPIYGSDDKYGDLIIKFKPIIPNNLTSQQLQSLQELFPKINEKKELPKEKEFELELATESDFEYSDSDEESEYSDEEESEYTDEEEELAEEDLEEASEEEEEEVIVGKKTKGKKK